MKNKILFCSLFFLLATITVTRAQETKDNTGHSVAPKTSGPVYMSVMGTKDGKVNIVVNDAAGNEVFSRLTEFEVTGVNTFAIDPPQQFTKGDYLVIITAGESIFKHKIVIN